MGPRGQGQWGMLPYGLPRDVARETSAQSWLADTAYLLQPKEETVQTDYEMKERNQQEYGTSPGLECVPWLDGWMDKVLVEGGSGAEEGCERR